MYGGSVTIQSTLAAGMVRITSIQSLWITRLIYAAMVAWLSLGYSRSSSCRTRQPRKNVVTITSGVP